MPARPSERDCTGKTFEKRVDDLYRALGYQVTYNVALHGQQTDLIARRPLEGAPTLVVAIECKDTEAPVGDKTVTEFIARILAQRGAEQVTSGVMVGARGFTSPARAVASDHENVLLLSWDELKAVVLNVRRQMTERVGSPVAFAGLHNEG
jgi:Restriction endonuclease